MASCPADGPVSSPADEPAGNLGSNARGYRDSYVGNYSARSAPDCGPDNGHSCPVSNREGNVGSDSVHCYPSDVESNLRNSPESNLGHNLGGSPPDDGGDFREYDLAH